MKFFSKFKIKHSLQTHILGIFISLLLFTFVAVMGYSHRENTRAIMNLGESIITHKRDIVIREINTHLSRAQILTNLGGQAYNSESEVNTENVRLIGLMREILRNYAHLSFVYTGTKSGKFLQLRRVNAYDHYHTDPEKKVPAGAIFAIRYIDQTSEKTSEVWIYEDQDKKILDKEFCTKTNYDHRTQSWYKTAAESRDPCWSDVYVFNSVQRPGVTISNPVYNEKTGEFIGVFAIDIETLQLSSILKEEKMGDKSSLFIVNTKGELISHSDNPKIMAQVKEGRLEIPLISNVDDPNLKEACQLFQKNKNRAFSFERDGINYLAAFLDFPSINSKETDGREIHNDEFSKKWNLGVIIEADQFVGDIKNIQWKVRWISVIIILLSIFVVILLARRISKPIILLAEEANKIRNFNLTGTVEVKSSIHELNLLNDAIVSMRQNIRAFSKFIPKVLVGKLLKNNQEIRVGGRTQRTTFFFTDIAGFTTICETYPADKLSVHLSEYFEEVTGIIFKYNGTIDKYIGDAVMAFWGAPVKDKDQAFNACKAALAIQKKLADLNQQWAAQDKPILNTRVGIHIGDAIVGNMGSSDRINYTALGDSVNLAARLEGTNKFYHTNIIISEDTLKEIGDRCLVRPLDIVAVKGKNEGIKIYELVGIIQGEPTLLPSKNQTAFCALFTKGYQLYTERRWEEAIETFQSIQQKFGEDYTASLYIKRCKEFKKNPPQEDWNGVIVLKDK